VSRPFLFGADELAGPHGRQLAGALEAARALEQVADDASVTNDTAFTERVMAALAREPSPMAGGFLLPLWRKGIFGGFAESLRQAWASSGSGRPALARAMALAYVLVVGAAGVSLAGAATFGAAGALGFLGPQATQEPSTEPTTAPQVKPLLPEESEESSAEPSEKPDASEAAEASPDESQGPDDRGDGSEPEASDDHGGNSGPGGGDDDNAGPSETDLPDASDDHGGSDGGSGPGGTDDHSGSDDGGFGGGSSGGSDD
jgi:uncharacterized membrane protein YgcG